MPKIVLLLVVIALLFVAYDALQRKALLAKPGGAELLLKIARRRKRRTCVLFAVGALFFMGAGLWQCIEPSLPPYGVAGTMLGHLANSALGTYGPAMGFFALGMTCLIALIKQIPSAFFQRSAQAGQ